MVIKSSETSPDGNTDNSTYDGSYTTTYLPKSVSPETWIKYTLPSGYAISKIELVGPLEECCVRYLDHVTVSVVHTGRNKETLCGEVEVKSVELEVADQTYTVYCGGVVGDEVVLRRGENKEVGELGPGLSEIKIYGYGGKNVFLERGRKDESHWSAKSIKFSRNHTKLIKERLEIYAI